MFTVPIAATVVPNPTVGTSLVLDTSGSMSAPSGVPGKDRMAVLLSSAPLFVHLLDTTDGVGVVRFDTDAAPVTPVVDAGPMIGGLGRGAALGAISGTVTNPLGLTAIGDGLEAAAAQLTPTTGLYEGTATIVFTDGHETADKTIAAASSSVGSRVFAIGLGTPDQLNPGALSDIANGTGGYLLLTGNPGVDDQLLLQKYFAQVLAGATNAAIVVDPDGFVPVGGKAVVPFDLTAADIRADVLVLSDAVGALRVELIGPDGTSITPGAGAEEVVHDSYRVLRVVPSAALPPGVGAGRWHAVLTVDDGGVEKWLANLRERLAGIADNRGGQLFERAVSALKTHGVPFTLSVQARSALHMSVAITQTSRLPGTTAQIRAVLTDSGVPLSGSARLEAQVTDPTGVVTIVPLAPASAGAAYTVSVVTSVAGVYRVLIRAVGGDLRGTPFTREELRTITVWARGDDAPPLVIDPVHPGTTGVDTCSLLLCLLRDQGVREFLERNKVDVDVVAACIKRSCRYDIHARDSRVSMVRTPARGRASRACARPGSPSRRATTRSAPAERTTIRRAVRGLVAAVRVSFRSARAERHRGLTGSFYGAAVTSWTVLWSCSDFLDRVRRGELTGPTNRRSVLTGHSRRKPGRPAARTSRE
ncbi:vWA domain-containing protein [Cellulomonas sp. ATA003]|uniref:vWA domain-containing protein n=1 Tax=Cellulomonas sp. ATA003 TaxID=3073064 RepID=UPI0028733CD6|nr:vWA domain-containing protein [Cellulomonas sp. ATA003]WNB86974.1 vWA domain-containing protein [Cellulomonas sp. ATA003]